MNHYETIFIVDLDTPDADQESIFEKLKSMISQDGQLIMFDDWGSKKFAYEIRKKKQGRFVRLDYCGEGVLVDEIERLFRLDYRILKFMTVLLAKDVDPESLMPVEEEAKAETEAVQAEETKEASAPDEAPDEASDETEETEETEATETESETEE
ncbi:MAG: 30S ribosomal protein S6 [Desulfobacteraceae bacterium]|nr:30S ribosomal protein S6 [Desulfobacteraceae bacterium]MBC2754713.1 30S ribosomal protein S6 [Desulfobacteraceae bacterium]